MKTKIIFSIALVLGVNQLKAQSWSAWEEIYPGVQISFKVSKCSSSPQIGKYLIGYSFYRTNNQIIREKSYLYGNFSWLDCDGVMKVTPFTIDLSESGIDDSQGMWFMGRQVVGIDQIRFEDYGQKEKEENNKRISDEVRRLVAEGDSYFQSDDYDRAIGSYEAALLYDLGLVEKSDINSKIADMKEARRQAEYEKARKEEEEKQAELDRKAEEEKKEKESREQPSAYMPVKSPEQVQQENFQRLKDENNQAQRNRDAQLQAETAAEVASMGVLGVFIFKNFGAEYDKDSNKFTRGAWRFNFTAGYSFSTLPIYENSDFTFSTPTSNNITSSTTSSDIQTINLDLGLQYWPYYNKGFGIGFFLDGSGGYLPASGGAQVAYTYSVGSKLFVGASSIKLVGSIQIGNRGFLYSSVYSAENTSTNSYGEGITEYTRFSGGLRFGFNTESSFGNLELLYLQEHYLYLKQISTMGFGIAFYAHNRIKIIGEVLLDAARLGSITYALEDDVENSGLYWKVGVTRSMDWFGQGK